MSGDRLRELCAELVEALDAELDLFETRHSDLIDRARALLAEAQPVSPPEPVEPTDEEWDLEKQHIWCIYKCTTHEGTEVVEEVDFMRALDDARAVLARWGRPAPEPQEKADYNHNS